MFWKIFAVAKISILLAPHPSLRDTFPHRGRPVQFVRTYHIDHHLCNMIYHISKQRFVSSLKNPPKRIFVNLINSTVGTVNGDVVKPFRIFKSVPFGNSSAVAELLERITIEKCAIRNVL